MWAALSLALVLVSDDHSAFVTHTSITEMRESFLRGDLVTLERSRALRSSRGEDVTVGPVALLDDLSRLVRCLPLGPLQPWEHQSYRAARSVVRLERVRLQRLIKEGIYSTTPLAELLV